MAHKFKKYFSSKKHYLTALLVLLLLVLMILLELTNTTHIFHKQKVVDIVPSTSTNTKNTTPSNTTDETTPQPSATNTDKTPASTSTTTGLELVAPYGLFVSTHVRTLDSSGSAEYSACNTTPGASCYIEFKQGDVTKRLATQVADSSGNTSWYWDVVTAKLTVGEWQVSATATLNGQSKTTSDQKLLEIK